MAQEYYLKLIDTLDKPFENVVFEKLVVLYDNIGDFATLLLDRTKLNPERRKMTDGMLREIARLFYEMVFRNSPAWQGAGKEFEKDILAFIEGEREIITLPPGVDPGKSEIYLHAGDGVVQSFFKGEKEFMKAFVDEAVKTTIEHARRLFFRVVAFDTEFLEKLMRCYGVVVDVRVAPNGTISVGLEVLDDDWNESDEWIWDWDDELLEPPEKRGDQQ
jgi:hypothetical protein